MATINVGGARKSTAPTYTPFAPVGQTAINAVPQQVAPAVQAPQRVQTAPAQDVSSSLSGFLSGNNRMEGGGNPARSPQFGQSFDPRAAAFAGQLATGLQTAGLLSANPALSGIGKMLGLASSVATQDDKEKNLADFGAAGLSAVGVPSAAISALRAAVTDDVGPLVNAAVNINPQLGMLNSLAGVLGIGTLGGLVQQKVIAPPAAPVSAPAQEAGDGDGTTTNTVGGGRQGFGVVGRDLGNLTYGSPRGGQGGGYGGYGGGIGQSGGNASGVGSNQA